MKKGRKEERKIEREEEKENALTIKLFYETCAACTIKLVTVVINSAQ